jgi:hypothetical protein
MRLFLPTARQTNWLLIIGFLAIGWALYLRYLAIEQSTVSLACDAGLKTWLCLSRKVATWLFNHYAFGATALVAAALNLIRPSLVLLALALAASGLGIVLYNVGTASLAVAFLVLSLARPAPALES